MTEVDKLQLEKFQQACRDIGNDAMAKIRAMSQEDEAKFWNGLTSVIRQLTEHLGPPTTQVVEVLHESEAVWVEPEIYVFRWNRFGRKGQRCTVLFRSMNRCAIRFDDGFLTITSTNAVTKWGGERHLKEWSTPK
jgi:hypothetical protein